MVDDLRRFEGASGLDVELLFEEMVEACIFERALSTPERRR
jgi:hypothetical protein